MNLLPGETTVSENQLPNLTLTSRRVRYTHVVSGQTRIVSITLDSVASCGIISKSYPILLILAGLAAVFGAFLVANDSGEGAMRNGTFLLALALGIAYLATRRVVLAISSAGESITVGASGQNPDAMIAFIDSVESAKLLSIGEANLITVAQAG
jgi:hypothetical protein